MLKRIKELENGKVLIMAAESDEDWAVSNGFSAELHEVEQASDGAYYLSEDMPELSLAELKQKAKEQVEADKDTKLSATCSLSVDGLGDIIFNQQAMLNVSSLLILGGEESQRYILANDEAVMASMEQLKEIATVFKTYVEGIYERKIQLFSLIDNCETSEELETLNLSV